MTKAVCSTGIRIVTISQDYELVYDRFSVHVMCFQSNKFLTNQKKCNRRAETQIYERGQTALLSVTRYTEHITQTVLYILSCSDFLFLFPFLHFTFYFTCWHRIFLLSFKAAPSTISLFSYLYLLSQPSPCSNPPPPCSTTISSSHHLQEKAERKQISEMLCCEF